jgi:radical SAM protein with 4Fe4S-binding SPASM domain
LSPGLFQCAAGQDRLALGPDGRVWGCRLFADLCAAKTSPPDLDAYCFGDIRDIAANGATAFSSVVRKYEALSMEGFSSAGRACRECPNLFLCTACPVTAAFSTGVLGGIPAWMCEMKKIWREEVAGFWSEAGPD